MASQGVHAIYPAASSVKGRSTNYAPSASHLNEHCLLFYTNSLRAMLSGRPIPLQSALGVVMLAILLTGAALAGTREDADAAYKQGDYATFLGLIKPLAEKGDATAQWAIAGRYAMGEGVPQDFAHAATWYRKAAEQGYAPAQYSLGVLCGDGKGVLQDFAQAATWYRKAAEQGYALAQTNLGLLYEDGKGVPHDFGKAATWLRKAAEQGDAAAQDNLGILYQDGKGVPLDSAEAVTWLRKAADQGYGPAENNLLASYMTLGKALSWARRAAELHCCAHVVQSGGGAGSCRRGYTPRPDRCEDDARPDC